MQNKYFPGALAARSTESIVASKLKDLGFTAENTLFAHSTCPDDVNYDNPKEDITALFQNRWGEMFPLGGLGGFPFSGKTGWNKLCNEYPRDGNVCLLFAPHVGINKAGEIGKVMRRGQEYTYIGVDPNSKLKGKFARKRKIG